MAGVIYLRTATGLLAMEPRPYELEAVLQELLAGDARLLRGASTGDPNELCLWTLADDSARARPAPATTHTSLLRGYAMCRYKERAPAQARCGEGMPWCSGLALAVSARDCWLRDPSAPSLIPSELCSPTLPSSP